MMSSECDDIKISTDVCENVAKDRNGLQYTSKRPYRATIYLIQGNRDQRYAKRRFVEGVEAECVMTSSFFLCKNLIFLFFMIRAKMR